MNYNRYRWCVASSCTNNSIKTPEKLFIKVPDDIETRNVWLELAKRNPKSLSTKSRLYLCEDHFNLEQDMENYMEYKIMGSVKHVKMKVNTTPSRFCFETEKKCRFSPSTSQSTLTNTQRLDFVQGTENSKLSEDYTEPTATSSKSDVPVLESEKNKADKATQVQTLTNDKSIQVQVLSKESKSVQANISAHYRNSNNENNNHSNLAACWKSATGEFQHGDQSGSNLPALTDAADDAGSSEDDNIPEPSPPPQLNLHTAQMCRVCLALDVKMFDLRDTEWKTMFQMTTGITVEENKGSKLGSLICWECAARLKAASRFRSKALFSDSLLQGLINEGEQIQQQYYETLKAEADNLISSKTLTVTEIVHIVEIEDQNNMTQLVQSDDDDEPSLSRNDETEIKIEIKDEHSEMDFEGDDNIAIKTEIEDDPTCPNTEEQIRTKILKEYRLDSTSSNEGTINSGYSRPLLDIGHTSLQSDSSSSQEDYDDQMSNTFIKTMTKSKIVPKQSKELKTPVKRSKVALSHDHTYYSKGCSKDINKKKKIKKIVELVKRFKNKKWQERHKSSEAVDLPQLLKRKILLPRS